MMASIFAVDAKMENRLGKETGREAIEKKFRSRFDHAPATKIFSCNHLIDIRGDRARSTVDYLVLEVDDDSASGLAVRQMGRYFDDWRREDDTWLIQNRRATEMNPKLLPAG
jgi:hypothetical protein